MKNYLALAVIAALTILVAACGGETKTVTVTEKAAAPPAQKKAPAQEDTDGDGVDDSLDGDPYSAESIEVPEPEPKPTDCDELGINPEKRNEGACTEPDGTKVKVANRNSKLMLKEVGVRLVGINPTDTIPVSYDTPLTGSFVVATVEVTNRMDAPVEIDGLEMFELLLEDKEFTADSDAMIEGDGSSGLVYETIQPDQTVTGDVIFRVAPKRIDSLETDGNFIAYQFSDVASYDTPTKRIGFIRTYE